MKKVFWIFLSAFLTFFTPSSHAFLYPLNQVYVPSFAETFSFGLGLIYYRPSTFEVDYAEIGDTSSVLNGVYQDNHLSNNNGILATFRYTIPDTGNDVFVNYSGIERHFIDSVSIQPGQVLLRTIADTTAPLVNAVLVIFNGATAFFITTPMTITNASMDSRFDYNSFSLEFGQFIAINHLVQLRFFGGLQYGNISQKLTAHYRGETVQTFTFSPPILVPFDDTPLNGFTLTSDVDQVSQQKSEFHGIGPLFGTELYIPLTKRIAFKSRLGVALLSGYTQNVLKDDLNFSNSVVTDFPGLVEIFTGNLDFPGRFLNISKDLNKITVVPNLNGLLALDCNIYQKPCSSISVNVEIGYRVDHYFAVQHHYGNKTLSDPRLFYNSMDVRFDGPYVSLVLSL